MENQPIMKLSALKEILSSSDEDLITSLKEGKSSDTLESKIFKILVLEDRGLRGEIEESIVKLERRHRPFDQLSKTFYRSHNSKGFQDLKKAIEKGHLSKDANAKTQPAKESNNTKAAATNQYYAGKNLKLAGSRILEFLFISFLFVTGWILSVFAGDFDYRFFQIAQIIYSLYSLVTIIRIAVALRKAGDLFMKK